MKETLWYGALLFEIVSGPLHLINGIKSKKKVIGEPWFPGLTFKMVLN
jgi:hypothetical protein